MHKQNILLRALKPLLRPLYNRLLGDIFKRIENQRITRIIQRKDIYTISSAAEFVVFNQIEGDYLEFGVQEGNSFTQAY